MSQEEESAKSCELQASDSSFFKYTYGQKAFNDGHYELLHLDQLKF